MKDQIKDMTVIEKGFASSSVGQPTSKIMNKKNPALFFVVLLMVLASITTSIGKSGSSNTVHEMIHEPISPAGSRYVWEEGMEPVLNLTPLNSDIFYYDIDSGAGGEILNIDIGDPAQRTIELNKLIYKTSAFNISFRYKGFGNYSAIGFLGEKYLAAYTNDSRVAKNQVNLLNRRILSKILIDEGDEHPLIEGKNLTLGADYVLRVRDVNTISRTAVISINRNETEVYHRIVKPGDIVIYEKAVDKVYSVNNYQKDVQKDFPVFLPIIAIHVDSITDVAVVIDGIFQSSDVYTDIDPEYGLLGITEVSDEGITMKNRIKAGLSTSDNMNFIIEQGAYISPIYFIGNIRLKLANSKTLRLFVNDENMPGNHERRGSVYSRTNPVLAWDGLNFPAFGYNIDLNSFSEKLEIINISGRKIMRGDLRYITGVKSPLEAAGIKGSEKYGLNTSFMIFGIGTDKYIAVNENSTELSRILIEHTGRDKKILVTDEVWELGEGYNLTMRSLDVRSSPRKALLSFSHNGTVLKEGWVAAGVPAGDFFSYSENVSSDLINTPKFFTYLDSVFAGEPDLAQLRYTFLRSDNIMRIHKGDRIGVFRVTGVEPDYISMENDIDIYLKPGSQPNLIGNLSFRVADANELRFYPSNTKGQEMLEESHEVENSVNRSANISETQSRNAGKIPGFEAVLAITILLTLNKIGKRRIK